MVFPARIPHIASIAIVFALAWTWPTARSFAEGEHDADTATRAEAKRLFDAGTERYDRGAYDDAMENFRRAYNLWPDPLVIFAEAQAQRLKGDCAKAQDNFTRFIKAVGPSAIREQAEQHLSELQRTCAAVKPTEDMPVPVDTLGSVSSGTVSPATVGATSTPKSPTVADITARSDEPRTSARLELVSAASGVLLGGLGFGTYLWNTSRLDRWRTENAWLGSDSTRTASADEVQRRQQVNDALSQSVRRYDELAIGLAITAGAVLVTTAVLYVFDGRSHGGWR